MIIPDNLDEFRKNYYYKTELIKICRLLKLPTTGTKANLNSYIEAYLFGKPVNAIKIKHCKNSTQKLTLDTKVLNSAFSFNNKARSFFADYFNVPKFTFKKEMAIIKRKVEEVNNVDFTIEDLINEYLLLSKNKENLQANPEEQTYQWNNFVRDFFEDENTEKYNQRLKVAAILWKHVKGSINPKKYESKLLVIYKDEIKIYLK